MNAGEAKAATPFERYYNNLVTIGSGTMAQYCTRPRDSSNVRPNL